VCLAAKPAVDGLEREFEGDARVVRANIQSDAGQRLARRYGIDVVPGFVVLDPAGRTVLRINGARGAPVAELRRALHAARTNLL
jgi:thiol-disulfide isomerase/thioredoxin